jgi:hypothetical protein
MYSRAVCVLFTKGSHHRNNSVILITQIFFHQAPHCRGISLNAKYLVVLKTFVIGTSLHTSREDLPEASASLRDAYLEATLNPHGYMILDFDQDTDDLLRFRTNVFPDEYPPVIYARVNDEAHKIQLSPSVSTQNGKTPIKKKPLFRSVTVS